MTNLPEVSRRDPANDQSRTQRIGVLVCKMVAAINAGDDQMVEAIILALSNRSRYLAPRALVVDAFVMFFQGVKLRSTNWKLTLVQMLPAMWIWAATIDLRAHALDGKEFHVFRGPLVAPLLLVIATITAVTFYLNAVFAFATTR